jgi:retron-type reverse transcriptase
VKSFEIDKRLIVEAWEKVRANNGAPGVDTIGIGLFAGQLRDNLYKLWNRMSSGSYFPGPVRGVEIPKDHGEGVRLLGVPNTADRVAQTAAAMLLEKELEPVFHRDSYGYRPGRSAHDALAVCRRRCRAQDWVLDLDVRAFSGLCSAFPAFKGGRSPHQRAVGPAVHLTVAESADADAGRDHGAAGEGDPAGQYHLVK